jgi:hypothetical protein
MTSSSPLPLATEIFLNVRCTAGHDVARRSCRFVWARRIMTALVRADTRAMYSNAKHSRARFRMTFRLQPRQEASVVTVAAQSP